MPKPDRLHQPGVHQSVQRGRPLRGERQVSGARHSSRQDDGLRLHHRVPGQCRNQVYSRYWKNSCRTCLKFLMRYVIFCYFFKYVGLFCLSLRERILTSSYKHSLINLVFSSLVHIWSWLHPQRERRVRVPGRLLPGRRGLLCPLPRGAGLHPDRRPVYLRQLEGPGALARRQDLHLPSRHGARTWR